MHKKAAKDIKEQLEAMGDNSAEKIKMLQQKLLEKTHEFNKLDRTHNSQKVSSLDLHLSAVRSCVTVLKQNF
jgi:hypothetical protein